MIWREQRLRFHKLAYMHRDTHGSIGPVWTFAMSGQNAKGALRLPSRVSRVLAVRLPFEQFATHSQAKHCQNGQHQARLGPDSKLDHRVLRANDEDEINRKRM
jgi:hypothetical protein